MQVGLHLKFKYGFIDASSIAFKGTSMKHKTTAATKRTQRGATPNRPNFRPEFVGIDTRTNRERWLAYQAKLAGMEVAA